MAAVEHLNGRQFTVAHHYTEEPNLHERTFSEEEGQRYGDGEVKVIDRAGKVVHTVDYTHRNQWDGGGRNQKDTHEISGFERYSAKGEERKGYGTAAQEAIERAHPGVPIRSYLDDMTPDAEAFHAKYTKAHPKTDWKLEYGTRWG